MAFDVYGLPDYQSGLFLQGFIPQSFTNTTMVIGPGSARSITSDWVIEYPGNVPNQPGDITINTAVIGANGVFPLALSTITPGSSIAGAPVYLIGDSSGKNVPGCVIATAAVGFVPSGYDMFVQIGLAFINSSGNLVPYICNGWYNDKQIMFADAVEILAAGASETIATVDISFLPANCIGNVNLLYTFTPGAAADTASLIPLGLTSTSKYPVEIKAAAALAQTGNFTMQVGSDAAEGNVAAIRYLVSGSDTLSLWVSGFQFTVPLVTP